MVKALDYSLPEQTNSDNRALRSVGLAPPPDWAYSIFADPQLAEEVLDDFIGFQSERAKPEDE